MHCGLFRVWRVLQWLPFGHLQGERWGRCELLVLSHWCQHTELRINFNYRMCVPGQHGAERRGGRLRVCPWVLRVGGVLQRLRPRDLQVQRRGRRGVHAMPRRRNNAIRGGLQLGQLHFFRLHRAGQRRRELHLQSGLRWQRQQWDLLGVPAQHLQIGSWRCRRM